MFKQSLYLTIYSVDELRKAANSSMQAEIVIEPGCHVVFNQGKLYAATYPSYFSTYSDSSKLNEPEFQKNKLVKVRYQGNVFDSSRFSYKPDGIDWESTMQAILRRFGNFLSQNDEHKIYQIKSRNHTLIYEFRDHEYKGYREFVEIDGEKCRISLYDIEDKPTLKKILLEIYNEI